MNARDEVLSRVRSALTPAAVEVTIPREYRGAGDHEPGSAEVVDRFVERMTDYKAQVHRVDLTTLPETLSEILRDGGGPIVVPAGLPAQWQAACASQGVVHIDGEPRVLTSAALDDVAAVVTACRVAIAETGTVVLDAAADQGRRALTLVPDHHVVVVFAEQVVASVPEALGRLDPTRPLTFISGPSATSDIEFQRVEGVHGPRTLDVIVVVRS
jgi:L-lactate dehydrogenase complex protein LldG